MLSSTPSQQLRDGRDELDHLIQEAGDVVFRLNQIGQILFASKRARRLIASARELCGQMLALHVNEADQAPLKAALAEVLQTLEPKLLEIRIKTPELEVWNELRISCYVNS